MGPAGVGGGGQRLLETKAHISPWCGSGGVASGPACPQLSMKNGPLTRFPQPALGWGGAVLTTPQWAPLPCPEAVCEQGARPAAWASPPLSRLLLLKLRFLSFAKCVCVAGVGAWF